MKLAFKGGSELLVLDIDRENKVLQIASSKTSMEFKRVPYWKLFDQGKERYQDQVTSKFDDNSFKAVIKLEMSLKGYTLVQE